MLLQKLNTSQKLYLRTNDTEYFLFSNYNTTYYFHYFLLYYSDSDNYPLSESKQLIGTNDY